MKKITLLKKLVSLILRNGVFLKLILNPSIKLVGSNLSSILSLVLELLSKHILFQELMKNVIYLIEKALMIFFLKDSVIGLVQVVVKPLTWKGINAFVLMCLRDARFKYFHTSILGMITSSLFDGPVYFNCYPDLTLALNYHCKTP